MATHTADLRRSSRLGEYRSVTVDDLLVFCLVYSVCKCSVFCLECVQVHCVTFLQRVRVRCVLFAACTSAPCFAFSVYECTVFCLQHARVHRVLLAACTNAPCFARSMHECAVFCLQRVRVHRVLLAACTSATTTVRAISAVVTRSCSSVSCTVCRSSRPRKSKLPLFCILV